MTASRPRTDQAEGSRFLASGDEAGTAPDDRAFRPDVEGLRAVAILLVVLFHVGLKQVRGGYVGVDVFFVVSGFVITGVLLRERASTGRTGYLAFYARRARRILPMALLVIVVSLVATRVLVGSHAAVPVASDSRWSAIFLSNLHFGSVLPTLFTARIDSPLQQFWSLAVEEQFYLIYPAVFVLLLVVPGRWSMKARLAAGLSVVIVTSLAWSVASSHVGELGAYYSLLPRAWELALGGVVAISTVWLRRLPVTLAAVVSWAGLCAIVISGMTISLDLAPYPGAIVAIPVVGTAMVIAGGAAAPAWGAESLLKLLPFRYLGRWSYSWYLWHWPFLAIAADRAHTAVFGSPISKNLILVTLALILSALTYALIENPVRHWAWLGANTGATLIASGLLIVSCVAFTYAF